MQNHILSLGWHNIKAFRCIFHQPYRVDYGIITSHKRNSSATTKNTLKPIMITPHTHTHTDIPSLSNRDEATGEFSTKTTKAITKCFLSSANVCFALHLLHMHFTCAKSLVSDFRICFSFTRFLLLCSLLLSA